LRQRRHRKVAIEWQLSHELVIPWIFRARDHGRAVACVNQISRASRPENAASPQLLNRIIEFGVADDLAWRYVATVTGALRQCCGCKRNAHRHDLIGKTADVADVAANSGGRARRYSGAAPHAP
jgi:hypothetical protein